MKKNWFPLFQSHEITENDVKSIKLFGEPLVLFRDKQQRIVCLQDRCPHRSTPLSLGRKANGNLECCYHGWQFGQKGKCLKIPARDSKSPIPDKAHANYKETLEYFNTIWIWADDPECVDYNTLPFPSLLEMEEQNFYCVPFSTEVNLPHELVLENLLDPAHLPFAHHGTLSKRSKAQAIEFIPLSDVEIGGLVNYERNQELTQYFRFFSPCLVQIDISLSSNKQCRQSHFCVPISQNTTKLFTFQYSNAYRWIMNNKLMKKMSASFSHRVIQQDLKVLSGQASNLRQGAAIWQQAIAADKLVVKYRKWHNKHVLNSVWFTQFNQ